MNPLEQHIRRISEKLQQLLKQYRAALKENEKLQKELNDIRVLQSGKNLHIEELEQKVAVLKTATNNMTDEDKKELERRINFFIKEIDRCITMLSE